MSKNHIIRTYVHSPPTKEWGSIQKKPIPSASMPLISLSPTHQPTLPVSIPTTYSVYATASTTPPLPTSPSIDVMSSCPTLTSRRSSTSSPYPPLSALCSLPEFKVGSLPRHSRSAWPVDMTNDFLTPPSNHSFSLSYPPSPSDDGNDDDQPLIFSMDEYI
ncbi:hypothetical protein BCR42DRAFT_401135 [Absidia repens]|uniref:Uncharacterized protein n=1 Tax=Absidia repens TaxID=90262 RepID=A0A1X2J255_9FUNG|nr:hypothetical protein BCR42DRAFT_401135 [Absidia repens]